MPNFIKACRDSDIVEDKIFAAWVHDTHIAFTRVKGRVHAFANVCTHDDGPLDEGAIEDCGGGKFCAVCPRHGAKFDLATGKATFPAASPIQIYETHEENGVVSVRL